MRLLELFSGTGSVGDVAHSMGYRVISVDNDERFNTTHCEDLLKLDYKNIPIPDFIWASPPCTTYSYAAIWFRHRDERGKALTPDARLADRLLKRTLEIINYFLGRNPRLKFCIENPRGYMQRQACLRNFYKTTTSYNQYGYPVYKPTDLFTNFELDLPSAMQKPGDLRICGSNAVAIRSRIGKIKRSNTEALTTMLGRIPARLVRKILKQARGRRSTTRNTSYRNSSRKKSRVRSQQVRGRKSSARTTLYRSRSHKKSRMRKRSRARSSALFKKRRI